MGDCCEIEGLLYKWTNYWGGWQPRWFVLSHGILAYYNNIDETGKGCRASLNISAGELKVHANDITRFDIILQHEQHWYLRASTVNERQKWLIAIGTIKAGASDSHIKKRKESSEAKDAIKTRISELRLYCDLLVRQVTDIKTEAGKDPPDSKKITEASSMLTATCDTFLGTLGHLITNVDENYFHASTFDHTGLREREDQPMTLQYSLTHKIKEKKRSHSRSVSVEEPVSKDSYGNSDTHSPSDSDNPVFRLHHSAPSTPIDVTLDKLSLQTDDAVKNDVSVAVTNLKVQRYIDVNSTLEEIEEKDTKKAVKGNDGSQTLEGETDTNDFKSEDCQLTFFSAMLHSFTDIVLEEDGGVPTTSFLSACDNLLPFLDTIGSTAFAPVKMDFSGNLKKIRMKQSTNPAQFSILQSIVQQEIATNTTKVRNSATDALLWLKRGLRFIQQFLMNVKNGENNLTVALNQAYSVTLKRYHGWVVKGIFALAVKAAPYHDDFIKALATDLDSIEYSRFYEVLMQDIEQYVTAIEVVLSIIDNFYQKHKLDLDIVVG